MAGHGASRDVERVKRLAGHREMIALHTWTGKKGLDACRVPAEARWARPFVVARPGQRIVAPLAGDRVRSGEDVTACDDATTNAGSEDHAEHDLRAQASPVGRFRERE